LIKEFANEEISFSDVVENNKSEIKKLIDECTQRIVNKNKIFFIGAGTSGRLGMIESSEIYPTFGDYTFIGLIAGGDSAMTQSIEGSEDSVSAGIIQLNNKGISSKDLVIGISTSGNTPYTISALDDSKSNKVKTCLISNISKSKYDINIELGVTKEKILGSTRMSSGTLTKQLLNMISTIAMIRSGKTYKNYMVNMKPLNKKLIKRSIDMISEIANTDLKSAEKLFECSNQEIKTAIVMYIKKISYQKAKNLIKDNDGFLSRII
jgi:N-acetylmuramic acid 6-phosphate etherase